MKFFITNIKKNLFLIIFLLIKGFNQNQEQKNICTLTNKESKDHFPSLSKCYKYNNEACCLSVHDDYINDYISQILSESCIRKYSDFENLMCFGCHPLESKYVERGDKPKIRICKRFALNLWSGPDSDDDYELLNKETTIFDNCGFKVDLEELSNLANGAKYIIPSEQFHNFSHFLQYIQIPFYEDFEIVIQNETDENCYNYSFNIKSSFLVLIIFFIF